MKFALTKPISIFLLRWLKDPEKRHPCRLIRLTGGSTHPKRTSVSFNMVDREVSIAEKGHPCRLVWLTRTSTLRKKRHPFSVFSVSSVAKKMRRNGVLRLYDIILYSLLKPRFSSRNCFSCNLAAISIRFKNSAL